MITVGISVITRGLWSAMLLDWGLLTCGADLSSARLSINNALSSFKTLHELLHNCSPERPETHQNHFQSAILHNNIRKVGSFRNRQVIGSSPIVGSIICLITPFPTFGGLVEGEV